MRVQIAVLMPRQMCKYVRIVYGGGMEQQSLWFIYINECKEQGRMDFNDCIWLQYFDGSNVYSGTGSSSNSRSNNQIYYENKFTRFSLDSFLNFDEWMTIWLPFTITVSHIWCIFFIMQCVRVFPDYSLAIHLTNVHPNGCFFWFCNICLPYALQQCKSPKSFNIRL